MSALLASVFVFAIGPAEAWRIEADRVTLINTLNNPSATRVVFRTPFDTVPVVVSLASRAGSNSSDLRIFNVTTTGFDIVQVEDSSWDGPHVSMNVDYIAAEPGHHAFPDGQEIIVGRFDTTAAQAGPSTGLTSTWDSVIFDTPLPGTPAVIAEIQTMNSESANPPATSSIPWLTSVVSNASSAGFDIAMERSEAGSGTLMSETLGYIALEAGALGNFLDTGGASINWEARRSGAIVDGWNDGCDSVTYATSPFGAPRVVASKNSRTDPDGGWLRYCSLGSTSISLTVDEDRAGDGERSHAGQVAATLAFDRSFHAEFAPEISAEKSVEIVEDPINGLTDPYAIAGARVRYTVRIQNTGNGRVDPGTIAFSDAIPENLTMIVSDMAGAGSGPVQFSEPDGATGLNYGFNSLGDSGDSLEFSCDGGASFNCVPVPGPDGTDSSVTHIRLRPTGPLKGDETGAPVTAVFEFDMLIR